MHRAEDRTDSWRTTIRILVIVVVDFEIFEVSSFLVASFEDVQLQDFWKT